MNQMMLVPLSNIHICPSYGQKVVHMLIFGHTLFGHNWTEIVNHNGSPGDYYLSTGGRWREIQVMMLISNF